jgi:hypothetical protein
MWCVDQFEDPKDMIHKLNKGENREVCRKADFIGSLKRLGWDGGNEGLLFECVDKDEDDIISSAYLTWFAKDKRKQLRREQAKKSRVSRLLGTLRSIRRLRKPWNTSNLTSRKSIQPACVLGDVPLIMMAQ